MSKNLRTVPLGTAPGQTARDQVKANVRYNGPLPDFTGQLRCGTGVYDNGRERTILINPDQLEAKQRKYPALRVLGKVA